ncbi:MAG: hypothetical protein K2M76_00575, partial [Muribaculaceae bacterium]|nr:hypothetical protein [Muribaculaceae bacterium]
PTVYLPNDFDGTSFTARWATVSGSNAYYIDVFTMAADGSRSYALENVKANTTNYTTSYAVTGLDATKQYYYCMRASNGTATSEDSEVIKLIRKLTSIDAPEQLPHTNVTASSFTANWKPVDNAVSYVANLYSHYTLPEEQIVSVLSEDFSGVKIGKFESVSLDGNLNDYTVDQGWMTDYMSKAFAPGCFVLAPYSGNGYLWTPNMNLGADGGKFSVMVNAAEASFGTYHNVGKFTVTLVDAIGDNVIEKGDTIAIAAKEFKDYEFSFTKGAANSRLLITYIQDAENKYKLYIESINVNQLMPAGAVVQKLVESVAVDGLSHDFTYAQTSNTRFSTTVQAVGLTVSGSGSMASEVEIYSEESAPLFVGQTSSIDAVSSNAEVVASEYYDMLGRRLAGEPQNGMYIRSLIYPSPSPRHAHDSPMPACGRE